MSLQVTWIDLHTQMQSGRIGNKNSRRGILRTKLPNLTHSMGSAVSSLIPLIECSQFITLAIHAYSYMLLGSLCHNACTVPCKRVGLLIKCVNRHCFIWGWLAFMHWWYMCNSVKVYYGHVYCKKKDCSTLFKQPLQAKLIEMSSAGAPYEF